MKGSLYLHPWEDDDLLLIDDIEMVHGRLPFEVVQEENPSYLIVQELYWDKNGNLIEQTQ